MAYRGLENGATRLLENGYGLLLEGPREIVIPYRTLENDSKRLFENGFGLLLEEVMEMATLALINTAIAAQGPASAASAAIQAALAADQALNSDLTANGSAVVVDTTKTPPAVTLYAATVITNPYGTAITQAGEGGNLGSLGPIYTYTATPVRTAT